MRRIERNKKTLKKCSFMRGPSSSLINLVFNLDCSLCTTSIVSRFFIPIHVVDKKIIKEIINNSKEERV